MRQFALYGYPLSNNHGSDNGPFQESNSLAKIVGKRATEREIVQKKRVVPSLRLVLGKTKGRPKRTLHVPNPTLKQTIIARWIPVPLQFWLQKQPPLDFDHPTDLNGRLCPAGPPNINAPNRHSLQRGTQPLCDIAQKGFGLG